MERMLHTIQFSDNPCMTLHDMYAHLAGLDKICPSPGGDTCKDLYRDGGYTCKDLYRDTVGGGVKRLQ